VCRHQAAPLYAEPTPAHGVGLRVQYVLRGHHRWVRCVKCDILGVIRHHGKGVNWTTPGKPAFEGREKHLAKARQWNEMLRSALPADPGTLVSQIA